MFKSIRKRFVLPIDIPPLTLVVAHRSFRNLGITDPYIRLYLPYS